MQIFVLLALGLTCSAVAEPSLTVDTSNGPIIGHLSSEYEEVIEYLGIPYAQPPVGELRFEAPRELQGKEKHIARNYGFDCPYTASSPIDFPGKTPQFDRIMGAFASENHNKQSEDCLTLNLWTRGTAAESKKPVLIHFYGGRWTSGTTDTPFYDGSNLAASEDIIVVTVNYRMNIFGFPGIPGQAPNAGLLDQRLAVEWIHQNIEGFGGDPERIAISGQSCGSAAVNYWPYAYKDNPLVAGLISHSGTVFSFPVNSPDLSAQHWHNVSSLLGCGSSDDVLQCMKNQNVSALLDAAGQIKPPSGSSPARTPPAFQPTVDDVTVFGDYQKLSDAGKFAHVPSLLGHNDNEAGYYKIPAYAHGTNISQVDWAQFNKETFTCPTDQEAANWIAAGIPTWRFRYFADWDNTRLYPTSGAYHGVDMNMIFGNSELVTELPESEAQRQLQKTMQHAWAAFAADPHNGLEELGWPQFGSKGSGLICLGKDNDPEVKFVDPKIYSSGCSKSDTELLEPN